MQKNNTLLIDDNSRIKILNEIDKNFFVVANAGSGKTSILVNRMVAMIEAGKDISKICAITFTKAAATEFLDRFQIKLRERENAPDNYEAKYPGDLGSSSAIKRNNCKVALKNINQCFLGTIDAFCNQVLSEYPLDAKIPSSASVIDDEEEKTAYLKEYTEISRDSSSQFYDSFKTFNALNKNAQDVFVKSISDVISATTLELVFNRPEISVNDALNELKGKYEKDIKDDIDELLKCDGLQVKTSDAKNDYDKNYKDFSRSAINLKRDWTLENFIEIVNSLRNSIKDLRFTDNPKTKVILFNFMKAKKVYNYKPEGNPFEVLVDLINNIKYNYSIDFLFKVQKQVREKLREEGKLTFDEYLLTFRKMLLDDMDNGMNIIKHIRNKHSYFLIDESQDTSPFQTELFLYLTSSVKAIKKEDCVPIPGSLFILGDPKQSIYRFRGADVPSYLNTKNLFENVFDKNENEVLLMTKNFRSTLPLINYFNDIFKDMENYYQIPQKANVNGTSGLFLCNDYINVIKEILNNDKYKIEAKQGDNKILRAPIYKDFLIISKSKEVHDEIINALRDNKIPCYVEGSFSISNTDIIKAIYAIFNYIVKLDNCYYTGALYDLLVSPVFGLSYDQVIGMTKEKLPNKINEYLDRIEKLTDINNPVILYDQILTNIELFKKVDFANMEYAYFVGEAIKDAYNNVRISSLDDALNFIGDFVSNNLERVMSMDFKPNAVKIANLHKVKGLEAPIVILYKSGTKTTNPTTRKDYINNKSYIMQTAKSESGYNTYNLKTNAFQNESDLEKVEEKSENDRLRYVAATRARSYLFIDNSSQNSFWKSLVNDSFKVFDINSDKDILPDKIEIEKQCNRIVDLEFDKKNTYEIQTPSKLELSKVKGKFDNSELDDSNNLDARLKGTIIHKLMELIVSSKFLIDKTKLINTIKIEFSISDPGYINILSEVYDKMTNGGYNQSNKRDNDLLSILKKANCYCEIPFSYKDGNDIWYGNIDLLYELDGKWFIVDYKTNYEDDDLDNEYKNQLNAYKKALKRIENIDAEAYIYHIG
ncbi:MAG: UvrD-helicase domain-containing protein [Acholeplasmatales bacterium]|nr:UvrD-helicase domain-containing protein [Acholeplasmatales bacterium]